MELYGSKGSIVVPDPNMFGGPVLLSHNLGSDWKEYSVEDMYLGKTNIINQDILKFNLSSLGLNNLIVIGNIPYNITSPIIFWLVEHFNSWDRAYLMVQKELAERLTAKIGTKDYSRITVMTGLYFDINISFLKFLQPQLIFLI